MDSICITILCTIKQANDLMNKSINQMPRAGINRVPTIKRSI